MQAASFLKYILAEVAGCPDITAQTALMGAARELCERALVWDEIQDPITLVDGVNEIDLDAPSGAQVCNVKAVYYGALTLGECDQPTLARWLPDWQTGQGAPRIYNGARDHTTLRLYPIPLAAGEPLVIHACYRPRLDASTLADFLADNYHDTLVAGTKARLMKMRNQQWSEPALAAACQHEFDLAVTEARIAMDQGKFQGSMVVAPRRFGR